MQPQTSGPNADDVSSCRVFYFQQSTSTTGLYVDANPTAGSSQPIAMVVSLPPYWFQTEKRKRVNKIKAIIDGLNQGAGDTGVYALYFLTIPNNLQPASGAIPYIARRVVVPTANQRYTTNNWGMHRVLSVALVSATADDMRIRAVEIDLAQGTA
jgi:hypothetical protein